MKVMFVFADMSLNKMATWLWSKCISALDTLNFCPLFGVLKEILSRYIKPLFSEVRKQGLNFFALLISVFLFFMLLRHLIML